MNLLRISTYQAVESDSPAGRAGRGLGTTDRTASSHGIFFTCHARWQGSLLFGVVFPESVGDQCMLCASRSQTWQRAVAAMVRIAELFDRMPQPMRQRQQKSIVRHTAVLDRAA